MEPKSTELHFTQSARMGEQPVGRLLVEFSFPPLVGMLVNATYNVVDTAFVGRLGHEAIAALTLVWPLQLVMLALSVGVAVGASSVISRRLGAGDQHLANLAGAQAFVLAAGIAVVFATIVLGWTDPILKLFGAGPQTLDLARDYLRTIIWFAPMISMPIVANALARSEGNPVFAMVVMVTTAVVNIILDPLLIFGAGPVPAMGVRGAAIATVIARGTAVAIYVGYFASRRSGFRFRLPNLKPLLGDWIRIFAVGSPTMTIQLGGCLVSMVANNVAASFGALALAAYGVLYRLMAFAFMPCVGLGQGVLPLAGYNYGAGAFDRVREIVFKGGLAAFTITTAAAAMYIGLPETVVALFNADPSFVVLAGRGVRIGTLLFAPVGAVVVLMAFFQGIGHTLPALVLALARQLLFYLPALLVLSRLHGLDGFWIAIPASDGLAIALALVWGTVALRRLGIPLFKRPE